MLDWDNTLGGELLDLLCAVLLPVVDVVVLADTHWATSEDDGAHVVVVTSSADGLLVSLGCTSLLSEDEAGSNPDGGSTESKSSSDGLSVVDTASSDNLDVLTSHWGLLSLAKLNNGWDENSGWGISGVSTSLTTLGADHINAEVEALLNMLWVSDHVHVKDTVLVELVNDSLWWDTDGGDEELGTRLNNNIDELVELALGVIVADKRVSIVVLRFACESVSDVLGLAGGAANLWEKEIDTEWCVLVVQVGLELSDLLAEHVWGVSNTSNNTETSGIGDSGSELWAGGNVHSSQNNWVVDLQEISGGGADLLYIFMSVFLCQGLVREQVAAVKAVTEGT